MSAQTIDINKVEDDGSHFILTTREYSGFPGIFIGLGAVKGDIGDKDTVMYQLKIRYGTTSQKTTIDEGRKLLLKLSDSTIIVLQNLSKIDVFDNKSEITRLSSGYTYTTHFVFPTYPISEKDLQRIMDLEVCKIRLEYDTGDYTIAEDKKEYKGKLKKALHTNNFSTIIRTAYQNIQKAFYEKKDIYSDF